MVDESQKEVRRLESGGTHVCERCGKEYSAYLIPIRDTFMAAYGWKSRKEEYRYLCQDCNWRYFEGDLGFGDDGG